MIRIGITGGIGSGKSMVCEIFSTLGIPVYNADHQARILTDQHPVIRQEIINKFGPDSYTRDRLDRKKIADQVFGNPAALKALNQIIHPVVFDDFEKWCQFHSQAPYVIKEAAILIESGAFKMMDAIILVYSPLELRIDRVLQRDQTDRNSVEARIQNQMPEEDKIKFSNFVIYNDEQQSLIKQVMAIHHKYC